MNSAERWLQGLLISWAFWIGGACAPNDPEVVRPSPGEPFLPRLPGPAAGGPYDSFSQALIASCRKILAKPGASVVHLRYQDFITQWRLSTEYCAWIYYTPENRYEISRLTDQSRVDPSYRFKRCALPTSVEDPRYPAHAIKYICAIHNHPYGDSLSEDDIRSIVSQGFIHGFEAETKDGTVLLSIVAFVSNDPTKPSCDGFYQYVPAAGSMYRWKQVDGAWACRKTGVIKWQNMEHYTLQKVDASCPDFSDMEAP
ncbi:hypothetical protein [Hyalangium versicolor]|uniref:hypothetical protein n=1 Tax=Hyalangium versicolor TaxID=2861190 RepID=UPI001CC95C36|nr:hypothetical protein [Hyalangium versicolor]